MQGPISAAVAAVSLLGASVTSLMLARMEGTPDLRSVAEAPAIAAMQPSPPQSAPMQPDPFPQASVRCSECDTVTAVYTHSDDPADAKPDRTQPRKKPRRQSGPVTAAVPWGEVGP